jgi:branched-subunit amino acid aminotransferase/4-amino-4-deoxychorismate lyase
MATFEGVKFAEKQMRYLLDGKDYGLFEVDDKVYAVSRSIHYGQFLAFEGIKFFCKKNTKGNLEAIFVNWNLNLERLQRSTAFCLGRDQQHLVPTPDEMENVLINQYMRDPSMRDFLEEMAGLDAQGYLRPFTFDEELSVGVTFPSMPSVRAMAFRYERYLGEPFYAAVVPHMVRAVGINGTGCLKLGSNYVISMKAVDVAKDVLPEATAALFLDDKPNIPLTERKITEWDSSCCLFVLRSGTVIKIPESPLILPSVTIQGVVAILKEKGIPVEERDITYGELIDKVKEDEIITICSVGTAGILNRCEKLLLVDCEGKILATHEADKGHELYEQLGKTRTHYWNIFQEKVQIPPGVRLHKYVL